MRLHSSIALLSAAGMGAWAQMQVVDLKAHSLHQPYLDTDMHCRWWDYGGDAVIRTDSYIRLTPNKPSREGWLFSKVPLTATNWEIEVEFSINGPGSLYGDGFAMWVTKQRGQPGKVFGSIDHFEGLGVFFDTYKNNRPGVTFPYVMAMLGDGKTEYDKDSDGKKNELAGCSARGIRNSQVATKAKLTYIQDQNLVLQLQYKEEGDWVECFDIPNVKIPTVAYLGFSSETGELSDNHDIISVATRNLYDAKAREKQRAEQIKESRKRRDRAKRGGWAWFFFKVFMFFVACGSAYAGFTFYRARQRSRF